MTIQMTDNLSFQVQTDNKSIEHQDTKTGRSKSGQKFATVMTEAQDKVNKNNDLKESAKSSEGTEELVNEESREFGDTASNEDDALEHHFVEPVAMVEVDSESVHLNIPGMTIVSGVKDPLKDAELLKTAGNQLPSPGNHLPVTGLINTENVTKKIPDQVLDISPEVSADEVDLKLSDLTGLDSLQSKLLNTNGEMENLNVKNMDVSVSRNNINLDIGASLARIDDAGQVKPGAMATVGSMANPITGSNQMTPMVQVLQDMTLNPQGSSKVWGEGVGERVQWMVNQKLNSATIRLDPPHLGKLDVQINLSSDATTININTQQAQTREMLEQASARLREFLQESGFENVNVDISHQQGKQDEASQLATVPQSADMDESQEDVDQSAQVIINKTINGLVDYFA